MNLKELIERFGQYIDDGTVSPKTRQNYLTWLQDMLSVIGDKPLSSFGVEDIITFRAAMSKAGSAKATIAAKLSAVIRFLKYLKKYHDYRAMLPEDIQELRPTVGKRVPAAVERWQVSEMLEQARDIEDEIIVYLLFTGGLRASELLSLTEKSIIVSQHNGGDLWSLRVAGKGDKERMLPINTEARGVLKRYLQYARTRRTSKQDEDGKLFPWSYNKLWYRVRMLGDRAGIKMHPHMFRHTFATELLESGTDIRKIAELLGHSGLGTVQVYTKVRPHTLREPVEGLKLRKISE